MFELILLILFLVVYIMYRIYRFIKRQSELEKIFWTDLQLFGSRKARNFYIDLKIILSIIAIGSAVFLFTALAYGQIPTWRAWSNPKFQEVALGTRIITLSQFIIFGGIALIKRIAKINAGKAILFIAVIIAIAVLIIAGFSIMYI